MATKNHNFRFNVEKEEEKRAWDLLHSKEVEQGFKSQNEFVMKAINDYYDRHLKKKDDPYLETREKEQEFTNRIIEAVQGSVFANLPALVGMYFMAKRNLENWIFWIVADIVCVPMMLYKGLGITSVQYLVFTVMAVIGYLEWKKNRVPNP